MGTKEGTADSGNRRITLNSVPGFAEIFACQYEALKSQMTGADGQELTKLEYLTELETMGEFVHYMYKPGLIRCRENLEGSICHIGCSDNRTSYGSDKCIEDGM